MKIKKIKERGLKMGESENVFWEYLRLQSELGIDVDALVKEAFDKYNKK